MENKTENKKNGSQMKKTRSMPTRKIELKRDTYFVINHGDLRFSFSVKNTVSPAGCEYQYVLIHHDTNFKDVSFVDSLNAKVKVTNTNGSVYQVSINEA